MQSHFVFYTHGEKKCAYGLIDENKQIGKRMDGTFICESIAKLNFIRHTSTCICILRIIECHDINLKLKEHFFFLENPLQ